MAHMHMHMLCTCYAHAMHMLCTCYAHAMHMLPLTLSRPAVSHAMLQDVMNALSGVGVLKQEQLLPPASLVAGLAADVDPDLIIAEDN